MNELINVTIEMRTKAIAFETVRTITILKTSLLPMCITDDIDRIISRINRKYNAAPYNLVKVEFNIIEKNVTVGHFYENIQMWDIDIENCLNIAFSTICDILNHNETENVIRKENENMKQTKVYLVMLDDLTIDSFDFVEGAYSSYEAAVKGIYDFCCNENIDIPVKETTYYYTVSDEDTKELLYSFEIISLVLKH